jgi:hypothetical protein
MEDADRIESPLPPVPERAIARWMRRRARWTKWTFRLFGAVTAYAICWIGAYALVNGDLDGKLIVQYFVLAWTGNGFVRPTFTWLISLVAFSTVVVVWWILARRCGRRQTRVRERDAAGDTP